MSLNSYDVDSSLLRASFPNERQPHRGYETESTSPLENRQPDEDCEPRRRNVLYHLEEYFQEREKTYGNDNDAAQHRCETGLDTAANSESIHQKRIEINVTSDLLRSELDMLEYILDQMLVTAYKNALRSGFAFLVNGLVSIIGSGFLVLQKSRIIELIYGACAATGLHGAYRTTYWWAAWYSLKCIKALQSRLEKGILRRTHSSYLEGASWSVLRNANLWTL